MSYYAGQQGAQYNDEYSAPPTPRDAYPSWELEQQQQQQQQQTQDSPQQVSDMQSQQAHEQQQQPQLQQPQQQHPSPIPPLYQLQPLEDPQHLVPSQIPPRGTHDLTPIRLLPVGSGSGSGRSPPVEIKPVMLHVDTAARTTAAPARPRSHAATYHPYHPRPTSASAPRADFEPHHLRFASQAHTPPTPVFPMSEYSVPPPPPPPASALPFTATSSSPTAHSPPRAPPPPEERRYIIRTDTYYDPATRVLTALLELPGLRRGDLRISLATTRFNRVRQVTVDGTSRPPYPRSRAALQLRERRYGRFTRAFPVPADTKPEDIDAAMEDGVLVLKIACGLPAADENAHEIPIR
ncbi:hypothetical protein B0H10DRAFT_2219520 [Mycena sp. CBHHK59/15]|nr:hypothetical protein B0H10DRAFT_2219520 [Mycena sp. CBHHK59/15]